MSKHWAVKNNARCAIWRAFRGQLFTIHAPYYQIHAQARQLRASICAARRRDPRILENKLELPLSRALRSELYGEFYPRGQGAKRELSTRDWRSFTIDVGEIG